MIVETTDSNLKSILKFTEPFIKNSIVIVMNNNDEYVEDLYSLKNKKIAVVKDYGYVINIKKEYPKIKFYEVDNIKDGLSAVSTGKYDAILCTFSLGIYTISEMSLQNLKVVGKTPVVTNVAFGIKNSYQPLVKIMDKALDRVDKQTQHNFLNKWVQHKYIEKIDYTLIYQIMFAMFLIFIVIFLWIRKEQKAKNRIEHLNDIIENERKNLRAIMDSQENLVITTNEQKILTANKAYLNFFQLNSAKESKDCVCDYFEVDENHKYLQKENDGKSWIEYVQQHHDKIHLVKLMKDEIKYIFKVAITDIDKKNHTVVFTDITQIENIQIELIIAKEKAEESTKLKSAFLANMSHEIRTPMNAVIGFADLLTETKLNSQQKSYAESIKIGAKSLLVIINDILDLSKIEANKLTLEYEAINPYTMFNDLNFIFAPKLKEKKLKLNINIDTNLPTSLLMDQTRTRQILFNLVGNAIKFTQNGNIDVDVKVLSLHVDRLDLSISVKDSGIGIPQNQFDKVFRKFEQTDGQSNREYGGTGLGLPICVNLAKLMDGEIKLKSVLGLGSTFTLNLYNVSIDLGTNSMQIKDKIQVVEPLDNNDYCVLYGKKTMNNKENIINILSDEVDGSYLKAQDGIFEDISLFSDKLAQITKEYEFVYLQEYADMLNEHIDNFDIENIEKALKSYPKIIKDLEDAKS